MAKSVKRKKLEKEAKTLGIEFDSDIDDEVLGSLIEAELDDNEGAVLAEDLADPNEPDDTDDLMDIDVVEDPAGVMVEGDEPSDEDFERVAGEIGKLIQGGKSSVPTQYTQKEVKIMALNRLKAIAGAIKLQRRRNRGEHSVVSNLLLEQKAIMDKTWIPELAGKYKTKRKETWVTKTIAKDHSV